MILRPSHSSWGKNEVPQAWQATVMGERRRYCIIGPRWLKDGVVAFRGRRTSRTVHPLAGLMVRGGSGAKLGLLKEFGEHGGGASMGLGRVPSRRPEKMDAVDKWPSGAWGDFPRVKSTRIGVVRNWGRISIPAAKNSSSRGTGRDSCRTTVW